MKDTKWKQLVNRPTGRESVEGNTYNIDCLRDIVEYMEECGCEEVTFTIYDNGNVAFAFENGVEIEYKEIIEPQQTKESVLEKLNDNKRNIQNTEKNISERQIESRGAER